MAATYMSHPIALFLASNITLTLTAAFTERDSRLRYAALAVLSLCSYALPWSLQRFVRSTGWVGRVPAGMGFWNSVTCSDRLILREWDFEHYGPYKLGKADVKDQSPTERGNALPSTRMDFGSEVSGLARGIDRFWEVKNVPHFSNSNPDLVPTRAAFMIVHSIAVVTCYYLHNFTAAAISSLDPQLICANHIPLLTRTTALTTVELRARTIASIGYWIIQYCMLQFFYSAGALVSAVLNPQSIKLWRPLFGSPKDAYTLRDFWGKAWHQTLRSGLEGVSNFLTHGVLQLPRHGLLQRYTKIFFSFAVSGAMHVVADMGGGLSMRQSGALQFFCMQALGIMIEDGVQAVYRQYFRSRNGGASTMLEKAIGYVWVLFFIVWTSAVWVFPAMLNMRKEDALLSLDAVKPLLWGR